MWSMSMPTGSGAAQPAGMRKIGIQYFNVSEPVEYHELRVEPGKHYDYRISGHAHPGL